MSALGRSVAKAAAAYAALGWHVFPCRPRGKEPITLDGFKAATTDRARVRKWWVETPGANIGLYPGPSGLLVVDIDGPKQEAIAQRLGLLAEPTLEAMTGREEGGRHRYYRAPAPPPVRESLEGLCVRCFKGYVVLPPSIHPLTGRRYAWRGPLDEVAELPPAALAELRQTVSAKRTEKTLGPAVRVPDAYVRAAIDGEVKRILAAPTGTRNVTLHRASVKLGNFCGAGLLGEEEAATVLLDAARASGYTSDDGERAALQTIRSGLAYGRHHPRVK